MKSFLVLFIMTLSLGSVMALDSSLESFLFIILYALGAYHLYRVNYGEAFFLTFHSPREVLKDEAKLRLGPGEFDLKDEAEKSEDQFIALFDWRKVIVRQFLSWGLFSGAIYLFYFRLGMEISLESVTPVLSFLFIMRAVSIGHLLVPLGINLFTILSVFPDLVGKKIIFFGLYGILFILTLALIYPSEERISFKIQQWKSGRVNEILRSMMVILMTFLIGNYLFADLHQKKDKEFLQNEVAQNTKNISRINSSLKRMAAEGIFQNKEILERAEFLSQEVQNLSPKESLLRGKMLEADFQQALSESPTPVLSPELLDLMRNDLNRRNGTGIDPALEKKMNDLLQRAEIFQGGDGSDLVSEYRELKYGKGGFYQEETEFDHSPADELSRQSLEQIKNSVQKKREVSEKLNQTIEKLKASPDEGLSAVNKALKEEYHKVDTLSESERESFNEALARAGEVRNNLISRARDPEIRQKIEELDFERKKLAQEMTPHMNAAQKAELAEKILNHQKRIETVGTELKQKITEDLNRESLRQEKTQKKSKENGWLKKVMKLGSIGLGAFFLLWFFSRLKKKGIKKVAGIPEELREELVQELRALKKRDLTAREEVIETYNVFHNALSALVFHTETPPSCIVYEGIRLSEPVLKDPTFTVTETFARTFYGNRDVSAESLKAFRRDMKRIFSFFGIKF